MRFMVIVKATERSEAGEIPTTEELTEMGAFNEELARAGIMLTADGLRASDKGARIAFKGGVPTVTDGPFAETKELVAGFWIISVKSKAEAIEWMRRAPFTDGRLEIRQLFEVEDFGDNATPELREKGRAFRERASENR